MKKKYFKFVLLIATVSIFTSCEDFLNPDYHSEKDPKEIYSNPEATNGAILKIYERMTENRSYRNRLIGYMGVNTDIETHSGSKSVTSSTIDRKALAVYTATPNLADGFDDTSGKDPWSNLYTCIDVSNQVVEYIQLYGNPDPNTNPVMANYLGEALTLRAFFYHDLVRIWGDVPSRFNLMTSANLYVSKSDRDLIYKKILLDLNYAETLVLWANQIPKNTNTTQRISLGVVKALKARIALQAAGYSMRKSSRDDAHIVRTLPSETRDSLYTVARKACEDIIAMEGTASGYKLMDKFENFFKQQCQDDVSSGKEAIFQMPFSKSRGEYLSYLGLRHEFQDKTSDTWATITIKNEVSVTPPFFYDFDPADERRDITVVPYKWRDGVQVMTAVNNFNLAKWRAEWCNRVIGSNDDGINFCIIRYADVLLMLAETINHLEGPSNAVKYLEQVRSRAFGGNPMLDLVTTKYPAFKTDKDQFLLALMDERAYEFCGENVRKWDLMRWGILEDKMNEAKKHLEQLRNSGEGSGDMGTYATVPNKVFWKWNSDNQTISIYGMNRDETDTSDKTSANGWNSKSWTNATESGTGLLLLDQATYVEKAIYQGSPTKNQLLPIMNVVLSNSQGSLTNEPLTNWTAN